MLELAAYLATCAPEIGSLTGQTIVQIESRGYPWAIRDNTANREVVPRPASYEEAVQVAEQLIAQGHNLDLGWAGINTGNLRRLGLSVGQVFMPCTNLASMQTIMKRFYWLSVSKYGNQGQQTFFQALSGYGSGSLWKGQKYVARFIETANSIATNGAPRPQPIPSDVHRMTPAPILVIADSDKSAN